MHHMSSDSASKLAKARNKAGLSTSELACRLGVSQSTVVRLEQSERRRSISLGSLEKAARALGCELHYELRPKCSPNHGGDSAFTARKRGCRRSRLGAQLRAESLAAGQALHGSERLRLALELSDFAARLKKR